VQIGGKEKPKDRFRHSSTLSFLQIVLVFARRFVTVRGSPSTAAHLLSSSSTHSQHSVMATSTAPAWHNAYPQPRNDVPNVVTRKAVLGWLQDGQKPGVDFLLIDLRRTDHEVRTSLSILACVCKAHTSSTLGRDNPRVSKPAGTEPLSQSTNLVEPVPNSEHQECHLLLR
jgi:hypothetical protein